MGLDDIVLMTGATGAIGSWLVQEALKDGVRVCAVVRPGVDQTAQERLRTGMGPAGCFDTGRLSAVEGDILEESLGIDCGQLPGRVVRVIHCAACTEFHETSSDLSYRTNVDGVRRVLEFAARQRAPLVHVSTAYVAGTRPGRVYEGELDVGQGFNNVYERTKLLGEAMVHCWAAETGLPATILRPSIVAGDWESGRALRFNTLYDMMQAMDALSPSMRGERLRVAANPAVTKNIIPADHFARLAWKIIRRGAVGTYHIVHPHPPTFAELRNIFAELFSLDRLEIVPPDAFEQDRATRAERLCHRAVAQYRPYMTRAEPVFDASATQAATGSAIELPRLDLSYFQRLLAYARQARWGRRPAQGPGRESSTRCVSEYFDVFLPARIGRNLLPDLRRLTAQFGVSVREEAAHHWALDVREGVLTSVSRGLGSADCRFTLDSPTLLEIVAARLTPQRAFFDGRAEISGDIAVGLKIAGIMAQFFRQYPFERVTGRSFHAHDAASI